MAMPLAVLVAHVTHHCTNGDTLPQQAFPLCGWDLGEIYTFFRFRHIV
jgi:hypothetical protein